MANYRNCGCGCNSGCQSCGSRRRCPNCSGTARADYNSFGALARIAGPFLRAANSQDPYYYPSNADYNAYPSYANNSNYSWENYPYYTGPCGPCESCQNCCCPNLPWPPPVPPVCPSVPPFTPTSAALTSTTPITVDAGGTVPLTLSAGGSSSITASGGGVQLANAGVYLVSYTVQIPADQTINSQFYLTLNGQTLANSLLTVNGTGPNSNTIQTIVQAPANSTLLLKSGSAVTLTEATGTVPFSMNITRIA